MEINTDVLDKETTYNPLLDGFKSDGSGLGRKDTQALSEYCLECSILDSRVEDIHHRLRGLCDNVPKETFIDHEISYSLHFPNNQTISLRVSRSLAQSKMPWQLKYVGGVEAGVKHSLMRNQVTVGCSENVTSFLTELGFRANTEFLNKGYLYRKGRLKIVVSKLCKMKEPGKTDDNSLEKITNSHLIEASITVPAGSEDPGRELQAFADQLKPLVNMEKIDHRRLQSQYSGQNQYS